MAKVAIAKRKAKRLAAASVIRDATNDCWLQSLYSVVDGLAVPFAMQMFDTKHEAMAEANTTLKTEDTDWVDIPDAEVDQYVAEHTANRWTT